MMDRIKSMFKERIKLTTVVIIIITWIYIAPFKQPKALYKLGGLRNCILRIPVYM